MILTIFYQKKYPFIFRSSFKNIKKNDEFLRLPAASASSVRRDCLGSDPAGSTRLHEAGQDCQDLGPIPSGNLT